MSSRHYGITLLVYSGHRSLESACPALAGIERILRTTDLPVALATVDLLGDRSVGSVSDELQPLLAYLAYQRDLAEGHLGWAQDAEDAINKSSYWGQRMALDVLESPLPTTNLRMPNLNFRSSSPDFTSSYATGKHVLRLAFSMQRPITKVRSRNTQKSTSPPKSAGLTILNAPGPYCRRGKQAKRLATASAWRATPHENDAIEGLLARAVAWLDSCNIDEASEAIQQLKQWIEADVNALRAGQPPMENPLVRSFASGLPELAVCWLFDAPSQTREQPFQCSSRRNHYSPTLMNA